MKTRTIRPAVLVVLLCLSSLFVFAPPGCSTAGEVSQKREEVVAAKSSIDATTAKTDAAIERMNAIVDLLEAERNAAAMNAASVPAGTREKSIAEEILASISDRLDRTELTLAAVVSANDAAKAKSADIEVRVKKSDAIVASSTDQTAANSGAVIGSLIGTFVPGAAALLPVLLGGLYRGVQLSRAKSALEGEVAEKDDAISKIVASIDALAEIAPEVKTAIGTHKNVIDLIQTPVGKTAVDAAKSANTAVPATA